MSKKLKDMTIDLVAAPIPNQAGRVARRAESESSMNHRKILDERCKEDLVSKNFIIRKDQGIKLKIKKKQSKTQGRPMTESEMVIQALDAYLKDVEIGDWRDVL